MSPRLGRRGPFRTLRRSQTGARSTVGSPGSSHPSSRAIFRAAAERDNRSRPTALCGHGLEVAGIPDSRPRDPCACPPGGLRLDANAQGPDHRFMRRASGLFLTSVLVGCFSPGVPEGSGTGDTDETGPSTGPSSGTDGTDSGDPTGNPTGNPTGDPTGPTSTTIDTETDGNDTGPEGDEPPNFESFEVNSSTTPEDVTESSLVELSATVADDIGVASVEFFDGETSLGVVTEEPWELGALVTSSDNGGHVYWAMATDTGEQTAESEEVQLVSSVDGGALVDVNEGLFEGCTVFGQFGGIAVVSPSRLVLAGTRCDALNLVDFNPPTILVADSDLEVLSSTTIDAWYAIPPTTLDDGRVLVPTSEVVNLTTTFWNYNVFDPLIGEFEPAAGLQFSGDLVYSAPVALNVPGEGVFLARSAAELALLEPDLDAAIWISDPGVGDQPASLKARALGQNGTIFVGVDSDGCPGASEDCIVKYNPDGSREWTRPVQSYIYEGGLASDERGGVFYGLRTPTGFLVAHLNEDGDEIASELLAFEDPPSAFVRVVADGQGGVVLAFAIGTQDMNSPGEVSGDESVLVRLDSSLQELWQLTGFGPGQSRGVALANDGRGGLLIAGIRAGAEVPTVAGMIGQVWLGRANF